MYTDDDSLYVWERHALPHDWQDRLLAIVPDDAMAPLTAAFQDIVRRHGDMAIIVWQVQELALAACGHDRPRLHAAYEPVCARLLDIAGSAWPITTALAEHLRGDDHVMQVQKRFLACEGEWRALLRLSDSGWLPVESERTAASHDWLVARGGVRLAVEVKTKLPLATTAGRLTRAFIGLGMLPRFAFLRELDYTWYADDDLNDATAFEFLQVFLNHASTIADAGRAGQVAHTMLESERGTLRLLVRTQRTFRVEFSWAAADGGDTRRVVFEAEPASVADHVFTGGGSARISSGPDAELPATAAAFKRLIRGKQMRRIAPETLVFLIWHMPFHAVSYDRERLQSFWQTWCAEQGIVRGALLPITPAGNAFAVFVTDAAQELDISGS